VTVVEGSCYTGLDNTTIHQADTNAEAGSASLVGGKIHLAGLPILGPGSEELCGYNSFHYHTSVTAEFDTVETFGEHVGVVILTAEVADL
jgi:hypothetical protein